MKPNLAFTATKHLKTLPVAAVLLMLSAQSVAVEHLEKEDPSLGRRGSASQSSDHAKAADEEEDKLSVAISLNHDAFFGFNPTVGVTYAADDKYDLTFYAIQWGAGTARDWGNWTEAGLGVGFSALDGALYINPQLGFTWGNLLAAGAVGEGVIGDGIVPNLTVNLNTPEWDGQFYAGYYRDLRDNAPVGGTTMEFLHYWAYGGRKFAGYFTGGVHFEELRRTGGSNIGDMDGYRWLGPYFQVAKNDAGLRFAFGADLTEDASSFSINDFYKAQIFYKF